jgi:putative hydrolase
MFMKYLDIVLLGIHPNIQNGLSRDVYTNLLITAIEKNPCIDMITHPNDNVYPVDYHRLCASAAEKGVAIELNNSRILYERSTVEDTMTMLDACKMHKCRVIVASDTHSIHELGGDESVAPILDKINFPRELLVTADARRAEEFIRERKRFKR